MFGLLPASIFFFLLGIVSSQTVSIQYEAAFYSQRECASDCQAIYPNYPPTHVADELSCATDPIENSCFCRADLQAQAENYIQSCVQQQCSNTLDANNAVSIYDAYCTSAGFTKAGVNMAATTTGTSLGSSSTSTNTNIESSVNSSSSSGTTFGGLTKAEFIGIVVGIVGVIVSAVGAYYTYLTLKK